MRAGAALPPVPARAAGLEALLAALPVPALAIDREARIVGLNPAVDGLLGPLEIGRHYMTALRQPGIVAAVEDSLSDGQARPVRYTHTAAGRDTLFDVHVAPLPAWPVGAGPEAQAPLLLLSFQDVTPLAEAGEMRRDFVANVSHELRTPLTSLMGFIETLAGPARDDPAAQARFLGTMQKEAERMNRLVGDLLSLSRVEAAERSRPRDAVDLGRVLAGVVRSLEPQAAAQDNTLKLALPDSPLMLRGDADQLVQVFTNIVENALKYGGPGLPVEISVGLAESTPALRGAAAQVVVRDHGPGIAARHLGRLTERFYRADDHRSRDLGGTGLGLAIVKHILNRHRGRLSVASEMGQGARFTVTLPLDPATA